MRTIPALAVAAVLALTGVGLLVATAASPAILAADAVEIPESRAGDALRYRLVENQGDDEPAAESVLDIVLEGRGAALDQYGSPQLVDLYRIQEQDNEGNVQVARCAALQGGHGAVRADALEGTPLGLMSIRASSFNIAFEEGYVVSNFFVATSYGGACLGRNALGGVTLQPGDAVPLERLRAFMPDLDRVEAAPAKAERATFEGRPALLLSYAASVDGDEEPDVRVNFTFADRLPAFAALTIDALGDEPERIREYVLTGFTRGEGEALLPLTDAALPETNPAGMAARDPLSLDERAFAFPYTFADAIASLTNDPHIRLAAWLDDHPDAALLGARYDRDARDPRAPHLATDGEWQVFFAEGSDAYAARSIRFAPAETTSLLGSQGKAAFNEDIDVFRLGEESVLDEPLDAHMLPPEVITSERIAELAAGHSFDVAGARYLDYGLYPGRDGWVPYLDISNVSPYEATQDGGVREAVALQLDHGKGALLDAYRGTSESTRAGILAPSPEFGGVQASRGAALAAIAGPLPGQGLGFGLTGLAVLLVIVKLVLVPLYTRLRADALLQHPVRAKLHAAVRERPGLHQAELVELAGVGKGAAVRHLDRLVRARHLVRLESGGFTRYYAAGALPPEVARREALLRGGSAREVFDLYCAHPGVSLREAARRLGMSAPSVYRVKARLVEEGLLPAAPQATLPAGR